MPSCGSDFNVRKRHSQVVLRDGLILDFYQNLAAADISLFVGGVYYYCMFSRCKPFDSESERLLPCVEYLVFREYTNPVSGIHGVLQFGYVGQFISNEAFYGRSFMSGYWNGEIGYFGSRIVYNECLGDFFGT